METNILAVTSTKSIVDFQEISSAILNTSKANGVAMSDDQAKEIAASLLTGLSYGEIESYIQRDIQVSLEGQTFNPYTALSSAFETLKTKHNVDQLTVILNAYVCTEHDFTSLTSCSLTFSEQELRNWLDMVFLRGHVQVNPSVVFDDDAFNVEIKLNLLNLEHFMHTCIYAGATHEYSDVPGRSPDMYLRHLYSEVIMPLAGIPNNIDVSDCMLKPLQFYCDKANVSPFYLEEKLSLDAGAAQYVFAYDSGIGYALSTDEEVDCD